MSVKAIVLAASVIFSASCAISGQAPNCGNMPCVTILNNNSEHCGTYDVPPAKDLINHAQKSATVVVTVTSSGSSTNLNYEVGPASQQFLGCSGTQAHGPITYSIKSVVWH
jgi:hypothetical protein